MVIKVRFSHEKNIGAFVFCSVSNCATICRHCLLLLLHLPVMLLHNFLLLFLTKGRRQLVSAAGPDRGRRTAAAAGASAGGRTSGRTTGTVACRWRGQEAARRRYAVAA